MQRVVKAVHGSIVSMQRVVPNVRVVHRVCSCCVTLVYSPLPPTNASVSRVVTCSVMSCRAGLSVSLSLGCSSRRSTSFRRPRVPVLLWLLLGEDRFTLGRSLGPQQLGLRRQGDCVGLTVEGELLGLTQFDT